MTSSNIWPEHLTLGRDDRVPDGLIDVAREFATANVADDIDLVIQYAVVGGHLRAKMYRQWHGVWSIIDPEDDGAFEHHAADLGVLMIRDRLTHFIPLRIADGAMADRPAFETSPNGSIAWLSGGNVSELYVRNGSSWYDSEGDAATIGDLFAHVSRWGHELRLVWTAPGKPLTVPVRADYAPLDEVLYRGETAYVIQRSSEPELYVVNTGKLEHIHYTNLTYVATPSRPLSEADAKARGIRGSDTACRACGDHGAATLPDDELFTAARLFIPADTAFCSAHRMHIAKTSRSFARELQYSLNLDVDPTTPAFDELAAAASL
jgi:hypothetical protein